MTTPSTKTWAVDDPLTAGDLNTYVRDNDAWLLGTKPSCQASRTPQSISNTTSTAASLTSEAWDTANMHSNSTNASRITIPSDGAGRYHITARAAFERFVALNGEIPALSRRNTNVRSLAIALDQRAKLATPCEESLQALESALADRHHAGGR